MNARKLMLEALAVVSLGPSVFGGETDRSFWSHTSIKMVATGGREARTESLTCKRRNAPRSMSSSFPRLPLPEPHHPAVPARRAARRTRRRRCAFCGAECHDLLHFYARVLAILAEPNRHFPSARLLCRWG
jgi:hypothetical protein